MSSAVRFNLDQSKILSPGKVLRVLGVNQEQVLQYNSKN